jgi:hypothetical protein
MSLKSFIEFLGESEVAQTQEQAATETNLEVVKKEIEHYKNNAARLKTFLTYEPKKAQEEYVKVSNGNSLLALEWEVLKMEHSIEMAKKAIQENTAKVAELIKDKETKLKEMTDKMNQIQ